MFLQIVLQAGFEFTKIVIQAGFEGLKIVLQADFESLNVALVRRLQFLEIALGGHALVDHKGMFTGDDFGLGLGHAHHGQAFDEIVGVEGDGFHRR